MTDNRPADLPMELDERAIGRKYGLRELVYPDSEQLKMLCLFLSDAVSTGKCGPVPKTAVVVMLEFLQGTLNRQQLTKGPRMSAEEFDMLQAPYYLATRIVTKLERERHEIAESKGRIYQTTYMSLNQFVEILRSLLDPGCHWLRLRTIPEGVSEVMEVLWRFALLFPEARKKGRAI